VEPSFKDAASFPAVYRAEVRRWQGFANKYGFKIIN
jgi:hypothetical protein